MSRADSPAAPTLARLSFWVPAARLSEFETTYETRLAPILKKHGLVESAERGRPTAEGVFSRLFEVEGPAAVAVKQKALQEDPEFKQVLQGLGASFGTAQPEGGIQYRFEIYSVPVGPGRVVPAGPGKKVKAGPGKGQWRTFDATDGLANGGLYWSILQDREGQLWFGSAGGAIRYDGQGFVAFTTADGLAGNGVGTILQDREGQLWFGTGDGVSCYDGKTWTTFTTADGLAGNMVWTILQDWEGDLWFGTWDGGVSRYDGKTWITFTTQEGLADNYVRDSFQDREGHLWFGTQGGGVSRYDGQVFQTLARQDGVAGNVVYAIGQDEEGALWFGTNHGVTRFTLRIRDYGG